MKVETRKLSLVVLPLIVIVACENEVTEPWPPADILSGTELVDASATANLGFALEFDELGDPHIAYVRSDHTQVRYAHRSNGEWFVETVAQGDEFWNGIDLDLELEHEPIVSYMRGFYRLDTQFEIASRGLGFWVPDTVDVDGYVGAQASIQLLPSGDVGAAYFAGYPNYDLRFAERVGGTWRIATVDSGGSTGYSPTLLLRDNADPLIFFSTGHLGLQFAERSGSKWIIRLLDSGIYTGSGLALTVDSFSRIHILYPDEGVFKYAVGFDPEEWTPEVVIPEGRTARSIAVDAQQQPWFVSWDGNTTKIGTRLSGRWFLEDLPGVVSAHVTMSRTEEGRIGIAYIQSDSLYFAWVTT